MEKVNFKDISEFDLKETLDGTEEIQVSPTEKVNLKDQLENTLSSLDETSKKPVNSVAVSNAIEKASGLTDNKDINSVLLELVLPEGIAASDVNEIIISDCYHHAGDGLYYNTVRFGLKSTGKRETLYSKNFATLEEAQADIGINGKIVGNEKMGYAFFKSAGFNRQIVYTNPTFSHPLTIECNTKIASYLNAQAIEIIENQIEYSSLVATEENAQFESDVAYKVGEENTLIKESRSSYLSCLVSGLKAGDYIIPNIRSGSSYPSFIQVQNGLVVASGMTSESLNEKIICDGTYDSIILNNYIPYVSQPTCIVGRVDDATDIISTINQRIKALENKDIAKKNLKILCFGNSFTQDSMSYVPFILRNIAPDLKLTLAIAYIGGCPLVQHCANFTNQPTVLGSTTYEVEPYTLQKCYSDGAKWVSEGSKYVSDLLANEDWDIITFQQNGTNSDSDWDIYYAPYIFKIHKALYEKVAKPVKIGWLSVHGSYKSTLEDLLLKWQGTVENSQKMENLTGNQIVFPFGTAVQNLRTTPLVNLGDGGFLMGDTAHLHEGIGCLAAAYANALKILEVAGYDSISIVGEKTRPTKEWCTSIGVPSPNYGSITQDVVGITDDNCYTAQIAAIMAIKKPYEVTDCNEFYHG